jgi:hypothetical protein
MPDLATHIDPRIFDGGPLSETTHLKERKAAAFSSHTDPSARITQVFRFSPLLSILDKVEDEYRNERIGCNELNRWAPLCWILELICPSR